MKLLLIASDVAFEDRVRRKAAHKGMDVQQSASTRETMEVMEARKGGYLEGYKAAIVDCDGADSDGFAFARYCREVASGVPVVLVSGLAANDQRAAARRAGAAAFFAKSDCIGLMLDLVEQMHGEGETAA